MDDWGTQRALLINPQTWREIFKPLYKDYIDIAHSHGKKIFMHSDGYTLEILPDLFEMGLDPINTQIFCIDFKDLARFKGKITLINRLKIKMKNNNLKLLKLAFSALFTAIICILAQISIPTPWGIPLTIQTLAVALCGYILGAKWATVSVAVYILLGVVGLPVFSNFKGGIHILFNVTGGFLFGFLFLSFFCGMAKKYINKIVKLILSVIGILLCHLCGIIGLIIVSNTNFIYAFLVASLPFLLKDFILTFIAFLLSKIIIKRLKL